MPGTIRVSVLEAVDLPEVITDGAVGKDVTAIVTLGPKLFKTQPGVADGGKIASWNSDFTFPVMNLRDKLVVSICDSEDRSMTQTAIEIPSIIQKGSRDEFVALNKGGRIHLRMSFVLTEEERKKIETMRVAALKRKKEAERLKKTVILQPVTLEKEQRKKPPVSTVAIAEVDISTTESPDERRDTAIAGDANKTDATVSADMMDTTGAKDSTLSADKTTPGDKKTSTPMGASPKPMFNYSKAIGVPPSSKKTVKKPSAAVADSFTDELKTDIGDAPRVEENTSESTTLAPSVETAAPVNSTTPEVAVNAELVTKAVNIITLGEVVEVPRYAESVSSSTAEETADVPRCAAPVEVDTSTQDFNWGDEFKATKSSDEVLGNSDHGAEIKAVVDQAAPPPTNVDIGAPTNEIEVGHSLIEEESSSLMLVSDDQQVVRSSFSGPLTSVRNSFSGPLTSMRSSFSGPLTSMRTVKSRVKRTLSRVSSMRSSTSLTRSPSLVQEVLRRAVSNVKGCYGFNPAAVHH